MTSSAQLLRIEVFEQRDCEFIGEFSGSGGEGWMDGELWDRTEWHNGQKSVIELPCMQPYYHQIQYSVD